MAPRSLPSKLLAPENACCPDPAAQARGRGGGRASRVAECQEVWVLVKTALPTSWPVGCAGLVCRSTSVTCSRCCCTTPARRLRRTARQNWVRRSGRGSGRAGAAASCRTRLTPCSRYCPGRRRRPGSAAARQRPDKRCRIVARYRRQLPAARRARSGSWLGGAHTRPAPGRAMTTCAVGSEEAGDGAGRTVKVRSSTAVLSP